MRTADRRFSHGSDVFRVAVAESDFDFRDLEVDDPKPTGRQLLEAAGLRPPEEHLIFQVLDDGALQERRLPETVDLRVDRVLRFIAFPSDRSFRVEVDRRRFEWGDESLTGLIAKQLVAADLERTGVWLEQHDEPDRFIDDADVVHLSQEGVEKLRTGPLYRLWVEGKRFRWPKPIINAEQVAELGGWDPSSLGVQEIDLSTNEARTLQPGEILDLRTIRNFAKKIGWRRGFS